MQNIDLLWDLAKGGKAPSQRVPDAENDIAGELMLFFLFGEVSGAKSDPTLESAKLILKFHICSVSGVQKPHLLFLRVV